MELNAMRIELQIEQLVLHGFDPSQRVAVGRAVERELARLLVARGVPQRRSVVARGTGGTSFDVGDRSPRVVGGQIASAVFGQISSAGRGGSR